MVLSKLRAVLLTASALIVTLFTAAPDHAGGVQSLPLLSIPLARTPITVDGNLSDWPDTQAATFVPIDTGLTQSSSAALARVRGLGAQASVQFCYDSEALYCGVRWKGLITGAGQQDMTLHIRTDRVVHVRVWPVALNLPPLLKERIGDASAWQNVFGNGARAAGVLLRDSTVVQEIRLPWSLLTASGTKPAGDLAIGIDFQWPAITTGLLRSLPNEVLHRSTHHTYCFLSSPEKLYTQAPVLMNPGDWGRLEFVDGVRPNATQWSPAGSGATETFVSRPATPPQIDGDLKEWNPAQFQTAAYQPGLLGSRYRARIASSYDARYLYIALASSATGGPYNPVAQSTQAGYGGGDCLQIRLNDGRKTINLCAWYDSTSRKPALTADTHDLANPFVLEQGGKEAFHPSPDGNGYTQEIAIPWAALGEAGAPAAGTAWRASFQVWWSGLEPTFTALASLSLAQGGGIPCSYTLPVESNVTLAVFDPQGHLIRTLVKDAHRRAGPNTEYWDGKDQYGEMVAPGAYQLRGVYHPPIDTQYAFTLDNPGVPPWPTTDGKGDWLSDEAAVQAAVTDGSHVFLSAPGSEKGNAIIAVGPDGRRIWGYQESSYPRCVSLALEGQFLYALFSGPELTDSSGRFKGQNAIGRANLVCLDKMTGAPAQFSLQHSDLRIATWPYTDRTGGLWDLRINRSFSPANYEGQTRYFANDVGEPTEAAGIAAAAGRLYVSMYSQNQLLVLDAVSGKQLDTIPLPNPVGLHARVDGRILAVSAGKVVALDPAAKTATTLIDHGLDAPHDVTTDAKGNVYVSDWGRSFTVKVFTAGGRLLRTIGKPGGRPWIGAWDPAGMLLPRGMAVTEAGELWVAEDDAQPNRVSVWNAATGAYLRNYLGPAPYGGGGNFWIDPNDPSTILAAGTLFHVDTTRKTWTPVATPFRRLSKDEAFTPNGMTGPPGSRTVVHDGKQYIFFSRGEYSMIVFRRDVDRLTPVAAMGCLGRYTTTDGTDQEMWDSDIGSHRVAGYYPDFFRGHNGDNFVWTDANGDGKVQPDEMQWVHTLGRGDPYVPGRQPESCSGWSYGYGPDGSIYFRGFCKDRDVVYRLDVQGWAATGGPQYDLASAKPILVETTPVQALYVSDENRLYVPRPYEYSPGKNALDCYDRDGNLLWSMARSVPTQGPEDIQADTILGGYKVPGVGSVLLTWLWHGNYHPYLMTTDGLYITSLLEDNRLGPKANWDESYRQFYQAPDGAAYLINGGNDAYHFLKIQGLGQIHRFAAALRVTDADLKTAGTVQPAAVGPVSVEQPVIHVDWAAAAPVVDGSLKDWDLSDAVSLTGSKGRAARVSLARDRTNLYLAYDVQGSKWVNKGGNWQTLFISGDCVDLMLSSVTGKQHYAAAAGDERLLIASFQGKPVAVLYRPVVPRTSTPVRLMGASIDQIVRLDGAKIAVQKNAGGYTLEASVPLADLGINPAAADTLRGDVGVIYADETGANRSLRLYYYNQHTSMTADLTTEATLQPGEWGDIEFPLGLNLLKNGNFETALVSQRTDGWTIGSEKLGKVTITDAEAYRGAHSLQLQQTEPVTFTPESYANPNYDQFIRSANAGKGGGFVQVTQQVPVVGGHSYSFRVHFKFRGALGGEPRNPGHPRGYDSFMVWLNWVGAPGAEWVTNIQSDQPTWRTLYNSRANYTMLNPSYHAPAGATGVVVSIQFVGSAEGHLPVVNVDGVELVDDQK